MKAKPIRQISSVGGNSPFKYWTYPISYDELTRFVKLHVEPSKRNLPSMSIVRFFIEGVTGVLIDRNEVANALMELGYSPINPNDSLGEWKFRIQLRNIVKVYSNHDTKNAIDSHDCLPEKLEYAEKEYRISNEKNDYLDEVLVVNDSNALIGMYIKK